MSYLKISRNQHLFYQSIEGDGRLPCLVFLHEGLGCSEMWGDFPQKLCRASGCPGLLYDRVGYGQSQALSAARTINYLHEYALQELPDVLNGLIPESSYILIGHSDGGSISLIHASERPSSLRAVITEAAHVFVDEETIAGINSAVAAWQQGKMRGLLQYHGDKTESLFRAWWETWLSSWFRHWNIEYLLPSIEAPLLILQGKDDQYGSAAQVDSIFSLTAGEAERTMIDDCGHTPHLEAEPVVLARMMRFIEKILAKHR